MWSSKGQRKDEKRKYWIWKFSYETNGQCLGQGFLILHQQEEGGTAATAVRTTLQDYCVFLAFPYDSGTNKLRSYEILLEAT